MNANMLVRHRDIQNWVSARKGQPAICRVRDRLGMMQSKLTLSFARDHATPTETPSQDDGMSPVSWSAWLAELDRQHLALRVAPEQPLGYEFVERRELN